MPRDAPTLTIARFSRILESHATTHLSLSQYRVLGMLAGGDERSARLAARLAVAKPTLTAVIDSLVERRLVTRETSDADRRAVRLSITSAGRDVLLLAEAELDEVFQDVVQRCADPAAVVAALDDVCSALNSRSADRAAGSTSTVAAVTR